jgi:bleomycin hydrolase
MSRSPLLAASLLAAAFLPAQAPPPAPDKAVYVEKYKDPILKEMEDANTKAGEAADEATAAIQKKTEDEQKAKDDAGRRFVMDFAKVVKPAGPGAFRKFWHNPPVAQYLTGTCWSFSMTSFMESEVHRLTGKKVKLSEMHTVYYEYLERARDYLRTRGATALGEGSEADALQRIWASYGAVPLEAYPGVLAADGRHDHSKLYERIENYLHYAKENGYWNEGETLAVLRVYLDGSLGRPPERFEYDGKTWTPLTFMTEYLRIDPSAYVSVMSTMRSPFWTQAELDAPDNWRRAADYYNVPLDDFMALLKKAAAGGFSACIGGDVSESGHYGFEDIAVVPSYDIPPALIDQSARELRIVNGTTTDDHGIHLVGHARAGGHDWYLIKDSGRSARWGRHEGYYMFRDDFIQLKMLTLTFHRDVLADLLPRFSGPAPGGEEGVGGR